MVKKYHISKSDKIVPCEAREGKCPLGGEHFDSINECKKYVESILSESNEIFSTFKKDFDKKYKVDDFYVPSVKDVEESERLKRKYCGASVFDVPFSDLAKIARFENAQRKGVLYQDYVIAKIGASPVHSSKDRGDYEKYEKFGEIKISFTNKNDNLNVRQVRTYQNIDEYVVMFVNENYPDRSKVFRLDSEQMKKEVALIGNVMHGTKTAAKGNKNVEHGFHIPIYNPDNKSAKRWNSTYFSHDLFDTICS